ncbi:MAG: SAM-dependent methyltransferase [Bdellovibrionales bacterium]|nr:SAM-dependent methyltransferase [Bdellovibrionales bacterium]
MIAISNRLRILCALVNPEIPLFDVGCDHGYLGLWAHSQLKTPTTLIDCQPHILEEFRLRWGKRYPEIETECGPAEQRDWESTPANIVIAGMGPEPIYRIAKSILTNGVHPETRLILCPEKRPFHLLMRLQELGWDTEAIGPKELNPEVIKTLDEIKISSIMGGLAHVESNKRTRFFFRLKGRLSKANRAEKQESDKSLQPEM